MNRATVPQQLVSHLANGRTPVEAAVLMHLTKHQLDQAVTDTLTALRARTLPHAVNRAWEVGWLRRERHGDHAGFNAHQRRGEDPCDDCKAGEREYRASRRARNPDQAAAGHTTAAA